MKIRCSTCVMPATAPGSGLDESSRCKWCRSGFPNYQPTGEDSLHRMVEAQRDHRGEVDCLVGVSGGKDSCFAALKLATDYGLRIEAFTYSHDGLTTEAMANARRVCSTLGVRHHVVSLKNHEHARSFTAYFRAWVESRDKVTAALTCVACKHLHLQGTQMAARHNIPMVVWANCPLETPPFLPLQVKTTSDRYRFKRERVLRSATRLVHAAVFSPRTVGAFASHFRTSLLGCAAVTPTAPGLRLLYPSVKHQFFYDYYSWDPVAIRKELAVRTGWVEPNAPDDWHSDCLYNVFKEYMFQSMYGASYTDAFLSNQVRHGLITRDEAWTALCRSKSFYASVLYETLDRVGCSDLRDRVNPDCFTTAVELE